MNKAPSASETGTDTKPTSSPVPQTALRNWRTAWVVLVVGLMITVAATLYMKSSVDRNAEQNFTTHCREIQKQISVRLDDHARILQSGAALFNASDFITREEWRIFTQTHKVEKQLPGIQGIGFSLLIPREELTRHIQKIRSEGFQQYKLRPDGDREIYTSIIYLEPFSGRNLRAFGYDMFSEPVRRKAMEQARDFDVAALSGKVVLVQETDQDVQTGTLMYVPVYRKGMTTETVAQRREALYGWVYSPYRMHDLMEGILGGWDLAERKGIRLQIFDNKQLAPDSFLYDSQPKVEMKTVNASRFTLQTPMVFNDHHWYLHFTSTKGQLNYGRVYSVVSSGAIISLLLFGLLNSILNTRFRAQQLADQLTVDLKESEQRFALAMQGANDGLWDWDMTTDRVYYSPRLKSMLGYTEDEISDNLDEWVSRVHPEDLKRSLENAKDFQRGHKRTYEIEFRMRHRDGHYVSILSRGFGVQDASGTIVRMVGTHVDITDRKRCEKALLELNAYNRKLIETSLDPLVTISKDGKVTDVNIATEKITGISREMLIGNNFSDYFTEPEMARVGYLQVFEAGAVTDYPLSIRHTTGAITEVLYNASVYRNEQGEILGVFAAARDISKRKQAEMELMRQRAFLRQVIDLIPNLIYVKDMEGRYLMANKSLAEAYGITPDQIVGKTDMDLGSTTEQSAEFQRDDNEVLSTGQIKCINEEPFTWQSGDLHFYQTTKLPLTDNQGLNIGLLCVSVDNTERKRAKDKLSSLLAELEHSNNDLEQFASIVSHDLQEPLRMVTSYTQLLGKRYEGQLDEKAYKYINYAVDGAIRMQSLISDLLTYSRLGTHSKSIELTDFHSILGKAISNLAAMIEESKAIVTNDELPTIRADASQLMQLFQNLLANAIKFRVKDVPSVHVSARDQGNEWVFSIRDNGIGIDPQYADRIFKIFQRLHTRQEYPGTGIGLAVCKRIVERRGGKIWFESEPGKGSTFFFTVPK